MFITLTIDTTKKNRKKVKMNKSNFNHAAGWRKAVHVRKRTMWQKIRAWRRSLKQGQYRFNGNVAMF